MNEITITRSQFVAKYGSDNAASLARRLGITRQAIQEWKGSDKPIPDSQILKVADILGIPPEQVRPDLAPIRYIQEPPLKTSDVSLVIDRLGGTTEVARICGIKPPSVSEWRTHGMPRPWRKYLREAYPDAFKGIPAQEELSA